MTEHAEVLKFNMEHLQVEQEKIPFWNTWRVTASHYWQFWIKWTRVWEPESKFLRHPGRTWGSSKKQLSDYSHTGWICFLPEPHRSHMQNSNWKAKPRAEFHKPHIGIMCRKLHLSDCKSLTFQHNTVELVNRAAERSGQKQPIQTPTVQAIQHRDKWSA